MKRVVTATILAACAACCRQEEIPREIEKLYSSQASARNEGALALARCGSRAEKAVPRLAALLYDENVGVQSSAAYALRKIDTKRAREVLERAEARRRERR
jgi:HEAT repeat protein